MTARALGCVLVLVVAAGLRAWGLDRWSLDGDEIYTWWDVHALLHGEDWSPGVRTHPLAYLAMAAAARLGGMEPVVLRLVPAMCGLLAVWRLLTGRRDVIPGRVALVAGGLAACSPWLIHSAQSARFYGPQLLFAVVAVQAALPGPRCRPTVAIAAVAAATACHPTGLLLLPVVLVPWFGPPLRWRPLLATAAALAAGAGLAWVLDDGTVARVVRRVVAAADPAHYGPGHLLLGLGYNLGPLTGLLAAWGLVAGRLPGKARPAAGDALPDGGASGSSAPGEARPAPPSLAWGALAPPAVLLTLALAGLSVHQRYAMVAMPATLLLAGWGVAELARRRPALGVLALVAALSAHGPALVGFLVDGNRHDAGALAAVLDERLGRDDIVVADEHATLGFYLMRDPALDDVQLIEDTLVDERKRRDFLANRRQVWVVLKSNRLSSAYDPDFMRWVRDHFTEMTRVGAAPPPLVRHDNRYVVYRRTRRIAGGRRRRVSR